MDTTTIDYTTMRAGTVIRRNREGAAVTKIARCPKCGRKGARHVTTLMSKSGGPIITYDHKGRLEFGAMLVIDDACLIASTPDEEDAR